MNNVLVCWLIVTQALIFVKYGASTNSPCSGENWIAFEDQCFKLIKKQATREEAEKLCIAEYWKTDDDSLVPTLATIQSTAEQSFLTKFVFETSGVQSNVWIGTTKNENHGSNLQFTNWAEGNPTEQMGNDCVEMQGISGKWRYVKCGAENYFVCKKLQSFSCSQIRQEIRDIKKELTEFRTDSEQTLDGVRNQLESLRRNPVPMGFVYVQLSDQPEPSSLWTQTQWENISSKYAGLFFRVLGGSSAAFGATQNENSPRISEIKNIIDNGNHQVDDLANGDWTSPLWTGSDNWCLSQLQSTKCYWSTLFKQSAGEVRPRNQAIRIWKRIQ